MIFTAAEQSWTNNPSAASEHASWADQVSSTTSWADQVARAPTQPSSWAGVSSGQVRDKFELSSS